MTRLSNTAYGLSAVSAVSFGLVTGIPAQAGELQVDRQCYLAVPETTVAVRGSGFVPGSPFTVQLDGSDLPGGAATINTDGTMTGSFAPPALAEDIGDQRFMLGLATAEETAQTSFTLTRFEATFFPRQGAAERLRVRFSLFGFALAGPVHQTYVHYIDPRGRAVRTVALGRPVGPCGAIARTPLKRLFPFKRIRVGTWRLQFDTQKDFRRGQTGSDFLYYTLKVKVEPRGKSKRRETGSLGESGRRVVPSAAARPAAGPQRLSEPPRPTAGSGSAGFDRGLAGPRLVAPGPGAAVDGVRTGRGLRRPHR